LRFYFWIQSFGRITGESTWDNNTDMFFLLQNHLWSFAPMIIFFFPAIYFAIKNIVGKKLRISTTDESISLFGFLLPFISFSTSHYQLPHYIFVLYPFAAIFTSNYICSQYLILKNKVPILILHFIILTAFVILIGMLTLYCFEMNYWITASYFALFITANALFLKLYSHGLKAIYFTILSYTMVNIGLNGLVYPTLLKYQTGSEAALCMQKLGLEKEKVISYMTDPGFAMDFYLHTLVNRVSDPEYPAQTNLNGYYVYTNEFGIQKLTELGYEPKIIYAGEDFHVTTLTPKFLNPSTRKETVEMKFLCVLTKK
ncbi:MAG: hypothetical protein K2Q22_10615, partial [Cytophagales bacterium]|nr:hypothetical protein [Cytophagales bacterium]